jgi:threonine/homoserine/homoserine lactone efflux protein
MASPVDPHLYLTFLGVMAVMAVTPGPANLFSVANGIERGKAAAVIGAIGMNTATLVWFGAAALGLGALVLAFPQVFRLIAIGGGVYVAWLGVQSIRGALRPPDQPQHALRVHRNRSAFYDGFAVQFANPKVVLFFGAVLPPFLDPARPLPPQLALFALATIGMDMVTMSAYGLGGAALSRRMTQPRFRRNYGLVVGALLLAAAALIILRE